MRVLIGCEFSGAVRDAFLRRGHDAWSCDLLPSESLAFGSHIVRNVIEILDDGWDLMIAFPPCTHLACSGARWFRFKQKEQAGAVNFFMLLANATIPKIAIENPVGIMSTLWRKPDQIIQPWQFGHGEVKTTCIWLKGLPLLKPTNIVDGREQKCWRMPPRKGIDRGRERSRTYQGIAEAMADQWGDI